MFLSNLVVPIGREVWARLQTKKLTLDGAFCFPQTSLAFLLFCLIRMTWPILKPILSLSFVSSDHPIRGTAEKHLFYHSDMPK